MSEVKYPAGWDAERVKRLIDHYEGMSEDELVAEDETASEEGGCQDEMEPTAAQFREALLAIAPLTSYQLRMLRAHYGAPRHTLTARQLAEAVGWDDYQPVNIWYGRFCHALAQSMGWSEEAADLRLILENADSGGPSGEAQLVMRPALVEALDSLCWSWAAPAADA